MSSSQGVTQSSLPPLLNEFEKLLILWAEHPAECDRKSLVRLNHDVCLALSTVNQKPSEYSQYLRKVLKIIKTPIRQSQPIPWKDIHALRELSGLTTTSQASKRKYVDIGASDVKEEEVDVKLTSERVSEEPRGRKSKPSKRKTSSNPGPSRKAKSSDDEMEVDSSDPASVLTEQCSYCIANSYEDCEKTGAQGACSACGHARVKCSMKDRVNEYWKLIGKIGRRSQSRSRSRAASEHKTPQPRRRTKSVTRSGVDGGDGSEDGESKPIKRARITPTSRINDLQLVIADLEARLSAAEAKLATVTGVQTLVGEHPDLSYILKAEQERKREREVERHERAAERREWEARGHELQAMSDIVTQLWEAGRPSMPQLPSHPVSLTDLSTVSPPLLSIANSQDAPRTKSLSPSEILALQAQLTPSSDMDVVIQGAKQDQAINSQAADVECHGEDVDMADIINENIAHDKDSPGHLQSKSGDIELARIAADVDSADELGGKGLDTIVEMVSAMLTGRVVPPSGDEEMVDIVKSAVPLAQAEPTREVSASLHEDLTTITSDSMRVSLEVSVSANVTAEARPEFLAGTHIDSMNIGSESSIAEPMDVPPPVSVPPSPFVKASPKLLDVVEMSTGRVEGKGSEREGLVVREASRSPEPSGSGNGDGVDTSAAVPNVPPVLDTPSYIVIEGQHVVKDGSKPPLCEEPTEQHSSRSSDGSAEEGSVVVNEVTGSLERRLRQRTPGIDYRLIGNPQARVARTKPTSQSDSSQSTIPAKSTSSGGEEHGNMTGYMYSMEGMNLIGRVTVPIVPVETRKRRTLPLHPR